MSQPPMTRKELELVEVIEVQEALERLLRKVAAKHYTWTGSILVRQRDLFLLLARYKSVLGYAWEAVP